MIEIGALAKTLGEIISFQHTRYRHFTRWAQAIFKALVIEPATIVDDVCLF